VPPVRKIRLVYVEMQGHALLRTRSSESSRHLVLTKDSDQRDLRLLAHTYASALSL